jgi:hypothetical protein
MGAPASEPVKPPTPNSAGSSIVQFIFSLLKLEHFFVIVQNKVKQQDKAGTTRRHTKQAQIKIVLHS